MTKAIEKCDSYEFNLSDELKVLTETELRETPATRDFALQAIRDWIEANPRIAASRMGKFKKNIFLSGSFFSRCLLQFYFIFYIALRCMELNHPN